MNKPADVARPRRKLPDVKNTELKKKPSVANNDDDDDFKGFVTNMADIIERPFDWVYKFVLARGELTTLDGDPDIGKTFLSVQISAWICDGAPKTPDGQSIEQGKVLYVSFENSKDKSLKPRMRAAGCVNMKNMDVVDVPGNIGQEQWMGWLHRALREGSYDLVVFDTLMYYLPDGTDWNSSKDVAHSNGILKQLAIDYDLAVMVIRHNNKNEKAAGLYRASGSIAATGMPRLGWAIAEYAGEGFPYEDKHRGMLQVKHNDTPPQDMRTFRLKAIETDGPASMVWGETVPDVTLSEMYAATWHKAKEKEQRDDEKEARNEARDKIAPKRAGAKDFIIDFCVVPQLIEDVVEAGRKEGHSEATIHRAKKELRDVGKLVELKLAPRGRGGVTTKWFVANANAVQTARKIVQDNPSMPRDELVERASRQSVDAYYIDMALIPKKPLGMLQ